jgi:hypothetical protein
MKSWLPTYVFPMSATRQDGYAETTAAPEEAWCTEGSREDGDARP